MYQSPEQLAAAGRTQIETAIRLAGVALRGFEQIVGLQLDAAKKALAEGTTGVRALAAIKNSREVAELPDRFVRPNLEQAQAYAAQMYGVARQLRQEIDEVVSSQVADFNKSLAAALDHAAQSAPTGASHAVSALRTALASANVVVDSMNELGRQLAEAVEGNAASFVSAGASRKQAA